MQQLYTEMNFLQWEKFAEAASICWQMTSFYYLHTSQHLLLYRITSNKGPANAELQIFIWREVFWQFVSFILLMCVMKIKLLPPPRFPEEQSERTNSFQPYTKAMWLTFQGLYDVSGSSLAFVV